MVVNLRSRRTQVLLNGVDLTPALIRLEVTDSQWEETSGLKKAAGTLLLSLATPNLNIDFDPRSNPTLWAKGNVLTVDVEDGAGNLVRHPRGYLHVLRVPKVCGPGDTELELAIGCTLTLQDWRQPPGDKSDVPRGFVTTRAAVISALAAAVGIPALTDPFPDTITGPQAQLGGGYVQLMGKLAAASNRILYIDGMGQLRLAPVAPVDSPDATDLVVARDASVWEREESQQAPVEIIKAHATVKRWKRPQDETLRIRSYSSNRTYNPSQISETTFDNQGLETGSHQWVLEPKGIVFDLEQPDPALIYALFEDKQTFYSAQSERFKQREEQAILQPLGKIFPDDYPLNTTPWPAQRRTVRYSYRKLATSRIVEELYEPAGIVDPPDEGFESSLFLTPILSSTKITEWHKYGEGWIKIQRTTNIKTGENNTRTEFGTAGSTQPPAPERAPEEYTLEEELVECEAQFPPPGANYERERSIEFPTAETKSQLCALAQTVGQILRAKNYPVNWAYDLRDSELANWQPLQLYEWNDSKEIGTYLAVGQSWTITQTQSVTAIDAYQTQRRELQSTPQDYSPLWTEATIVELTLELFSEVITYDVLPVETTVLAGDLELIGGIGPPIYGGDLELVGGIDSLSDPPAPAINFDTIVVDGNGNVVTANGFVISTDANPAFDTIVVDGNGNVVTANGFVISTDANPAFDTIVVDGNGNVVTANGFVVTAT